MKLSAELLAYLLSDEEAQIVFPQLKDNMETVIESKCYEMLEQIRQILMDISLDDQDCFFRVEEIICLFEKYKIYTGFRHDLS